MRTAAVKVNRKLSLGYLNGMTDLTAAGAPWFHVSSVASSSMATSGALPPGAELSCASRLQVGSGGTREVLFTFPYPKGSVQTLPVHGCKYPVSDADEVSDGAD